MLVQQLIGCCQRHLIFLQSTVKCWETRAYICSCYTKFARMKEYMDRVPTHGAFKRQTLPQSHRGGYSLVFEAATSVQSSSAYSNTQAGWAHAKIHHGLLQKMKVDVNSWRVGI
ncbi:hypothetical protein MTR67_015379 [Solanum verrucosum]|uniref:Uncharacterized protein n=1 Tax=Solanum verrucosum TaxID=315347 RepID=A0AAF0QLB5_SOLVR|nr:hypothetical protein MTR67_015379 [Solanum verrucosum]